MDKMLKVATKMNCEEQKICILKVGRGSVMQAKKRVRKQAHLQKWDVRVRMALAQ